MTSSHQRTHPLRIKLSDDMARRFDALSAQYGMPSSTLAALAIGEFVLGRERALKRTVSGSSDVAQAAAGSPSAAGGPDRASNAA